jgi:hypothetical protein
MLPLLLLLAPALAAASYAPTMLPATAAVALRRFNASALYTLSVPGAAYPEGPVYLLDLHGDTRYAQGYAYGALLGAEITEVRVGQHGVIYGIYTTVCCVDERARERESGKRERERESTHDTTAPLAPAADVCDVYGAAYWLSEREIAREEREIERGERARAKRERRER